MNQLRSDKRFTENIIPSASNKNTYIIERTSGEENMINDLESFNEKELSLLIDRLNQSELSESDKKTIRNVIHLLSCSLDHVDTLK